MAIDVELGTALSVNVIRVVKLLHAMRATAPRFHPAVEQASYPLLMALDEAPSRVSALAERTYSDASVVSRQVSHLEQLGLAAKTPDPEDGRASLVGLTAEGDALVAAILAGRGRWFAELLADWTEDEAREFDRHLGRLADTLHHELCHRASGGAVATTPQENP